MTKGLHLGQGSGEGNRFEETLAPRQPAGPHAGAATGPGTLPVPECQPNTRMKAGQAGSSFDRKVRWRASGLVPAVRSAGTSTAARRSALPRKR